MNFNFLGVKIKCYTSSGNHTSQVFGLVRAILNVFGRFQSEKTIFSSSVDLVVQGNVHFLAPKEAGTSGFIASRPFG